MVDSTPATASAGTVTASTGSTAALAGVESTTYAGTPVASITLALSGNAATASVGALGSDVPYLGSLLGSTRKAGSTRRNVQTASRSNRQNATR